MKTPEPPASCQCDLCQSFPPADAQPLPPQADGNQLAQEREAMAALDAIAEPRNDAPQANDGPVQAIAGGTAGETIKGIFCFRGEANGANQSTQSP